MFLNLFIVTARSFPGKLGFADCGSNSLFPLGCPQPLPPDLVTVKANMVQDFVVGMAGILSQELGHSLLQLEKGAGLASGQSQVLVFGGEYEHMMFPFIRCQAASRLSAIWFRVPSPASMVAIFPTTMSCMPFCAEPELVGHARHRSCRTLASKEL
jgi:hypothetical protein